MSLGLDSNTFTVPNVHASIPNVLNNSSTVLHANT